jgi:hypothetical protein
VRATSNQCRDGGNQLGGVDRFGDVTLIAAAQRPRSILGASECGQRNRGDRLPSAGSPYGFTVVGAGLAAGAAMMLATFLAASNPAKAPTVQIETSQSYRLSD